MRMGHRMRRMVSRVFHIQMKMGEHHGQPFDTRGKVFLPLSFDPIIEDLFQDVVCIFVDPQTLKYFFVSEDIIVAEGNIDVECVEEVLKANGLQWDQLMENDPQLLDAYSINVKLDLVESPTLYQASYDTWRHGYGVASWSSLVKTAKEQSINLKAS